MSTETILTEISNLENTSENTSENISNLENISNPVIKLKISNVVKLKVLKPKMSKLEDNQRRQLFSNFIHNRYIFDENSEISEKALHTNFISYLEEQLRPSLKRDCSMNKLREYIKELNKDTQECRIRRSSATMRYKGLMIKPDVENKRRHLSKAEISEIEDLIINKLDNEAVSKNWLKLDPNDKTNNLKIQIYKWVEDYLIDTSFTGNSKNVSEIGTNIYEAILTTIKDIRNQKTIKINS